MLNLIFYLFTTIAFCWFVLFTFSVIHNKSLLMINKKAESPYDWVLKIKNIKFKSIILNPFKLAFVAVFGQKND